MKASRMYQLFSENTLAKILLPVNLIVSAMIFNWSEFLAYLSKVNQSGCKPILISPGSKISFGIYDSASRNSDLEFILGASLVIFSIFYLPSYLATFLVVGAMKSDYPHWCIETFDLIFIPIFCVINFMYLIFLSHLIKRIHDYYCQHKSEPEKPLSIYPK